MLFSNKNAITRAGKQAPCVNRGGKTRRFQELCRPTDSSFLYFFQEPLLRACAGDQMNSVGKVLSQLNTVYLL